MARRNSVQPSPGGLITAQAKNALQAERTDPVLLVGHVPHRLEPKAQWLSSALEDRPRRHRCLTLTPVASQLTPRRRPGVGSAARRASKTFRPTNTPKKLRTRRLRHEPRVEFSQGARVVDPGAFGMGCRVRHPNILTSRERSGYPIPPITKNCSSSMPYTPVNGGAKLVHPGGAKLVHLTLCGTRCWGVVR